MKYFLIMIAGFLLVSAALPSLAEAQASGLIPCTNTCTFDDLIILAQNVVEFLIFKIAAPIAAVMFAYAGFLWVTNGGNESQISTAKSIFWAVFIGFVVALAAWLTVNMIVTFFLSPSYSLLSAP